MRTRKLSFILAVLLAFCFGSIATETTAAPLVLATPTIVKHLHPKPHKRRHKHRRHKHHHKKTLGTLPSR